VQAPSVQIGLFPAELSSEDVLEEVVAALPPLPPIIRYYDYFDDTIRSIRAPASLDRFVLVVLGRNRSIDFNRFPGSYGRLLKHTFMFLLGQDINVTTATDYVCAASHLTRTDVIEVIQSGPLEIDKIWAKLRSRNLTISTYILVKALLQLLCCYRLHGWAESYEPFIRYNLPLPSVDTHIGIRSGDVFLGADDEAKIVRHLDDMAAAVTAEGFLAEVPGDLNDAGLLLCAYQFAMRPVQIAMLSMRNVRVWSEENSTTATVHLTFHMAKQRGTEERHPLTRRVKREWAPIFDALLDRHRLACSAATARFFDVESTHETGARISTLVRKLIGSDTLGTATDLRHTAAQRLVDAGASHEELAEFMGHSHTQTGLVYYQTSATHAERVNRALGASDVYRRIAKIAHDRFITAEELAHLKGEQQVAGVPHGIPIAGIGGCSSGQPTCPYNPVTACYGCRKFMPLRDKAIHEQVLADMRSVVLFFSESSRGDTRSPAYLQLQRTIAEIQIVLTELDADRS